MASDREYGKEAVKIKEEKENKIEKIDIVKKNWRNKKD